MFSNISLWVRTQQNKWEPEHCFNDTSSLQLPELVNHSKNILSSTHERGKHFACQERSEMLFTFICNTGSPGNSRLVEKENDSYGQLIYCFNSHQSDNCDSPGTFYS